MSDVERVPQNGNKQEKVRQLLPSIVQKVQLLLTEDTTLSDAMKQCVEAALTASPETILSDILDHSRSVGAMDLERQIRAALNQRVLKEMVDNLTDEEKKNTNSLIHFLQHAVFIPSKSRHR